MEKTPEQQFQEWMSSQSGYIGKTAKNSWWNNYNQGVKNQATQDNIFGEGPTDFTVTGSPNEVTGRLEGLQRAKILTGQNPFEIGKDYQEAYQTIKKRSKGEDLSSELLRANKAGAIAETRNNLQQNGVKGGSAIGAVSAVERAKSYDVNNQMMQNQRTATTDYMNAAKANANFTQANEMNFGQMALGKDVKAPSQQSGGFGNMGTVICTELFMQGILDIETMAKDFDYGVKTLNERPDIYWGYRYMADPIVRLMKKSAIFTQMVAFFAVPWAENMAGKKNLFGKLIAMVGEPLCSIVGKIILSGENHGYQKAKR